jgi:hypothetical protein
MFKTCERFESNFNHSRLLLITASVVFRHKRRKNPDDNCYFAYVWLYVNIFSFTKIKAYKSIHLMKSDLNERTRERVCTVKRAERVKKMCTRSFLLCASYIKHRIPGKTLALLMLTGLHTKVLKACESFALSLHCWIQSSFLQKY